MDLQRRLDLVVYGAIASGGALCCDATLVSPLTRQGEPQAHADSEDGAALRLAERRKRTTYPDLCGPGTQRLLVLGAEVGGRWNSEARSFLRTLVRLRSLRAPAAVRRSAASRWARRWWASWPWPCNKLWARPRLAKPGPQPRSGPPGTRRWSESTWLTARGQPSHPCGRPRSLVTSADQNGSCRRKRAVEKKTHGWRNAVDGSWGHVPGRAEKVAAWGLVLWSPDVPPSQWAAMGGEVPCDPEGRNGSARAELEALRVACQYAACPPVMLSDSLTCAMQQVSLVCTDRVAIRHVTGHGNHIGNCWAHEAATQARVHGVFLQEGLPTLRP